MSDRNPFLDELLQLTATPNPAAPQVEGYLCAQAIIAPESLDPAAIAAALTELDGRPGQAAKPEIEDLVVDALDWICDQLAQGSYRPPAEDASWRRGFSRSVEVNEETWTRLNAEHTAAAIDYLRLMWLIDPEQVGDVLAALDPEFSEALKLDPAQLGWVLGEVYQGYWGDRDEAWEAEDLGEPPTLEDLPEMPAEELAQLDDQALFQRLREYGDLLPRSAIEAAIARGPALVPRLREHLLGSEAWGDGGDEDDWWGLLHCINVLGGIPGPAAADALLEALELTEREREDPLWEWVDETWPALFRNKFELVQDRLLDLLRDTDRYWYTRTMAMLSLVHGAQQAGPEALEPVLEQLAGLLANPDDDLELLDIVAYKLLDYPRLAHRQALDAYAAMLAARRLLGVEAAEVETAYRRGRDAPDPVQEPLDFYVPGQILDRQRQLYGQLQADLEADLEDEGGVWDGEAWDNEGLNPPVDWLTPPSEPYVRAVPKVGRNDPCPCGSGKKYKKCCLGKVGD